MSKDHTVSERSRSTLRIGSIAAVLYFSEGLPNGLFRTLIPTYLRVAHVDLTTIGHINAIGFAWALKFAWSPLVDAFATYRRWISGAVLAIALALAAMAALPIGPLFYACVALLAIASATQDIAVDAYTIRATPKEILGPVNSIRVAAYRLSLTVPGGLIILAGFAGWAAGFGLAATLACAFFLYTFFLAEQEQGSRENGSRDFLAALRQWLTRPKSGLLLAIVFLYRLGELSIAAMIQPYWVDRGYTPAEIGTITAVIGVIISIAGAITGGLVVARFGLYRSLIALGIAQTVSNLGYAIVATTGAGRWAIYAAAATENFGYGLGNAAFLSLLMSLCDRERAATEYALLSAAFNLTGTIMAYFSGSLIDVYGYARYFWLTVALGIPALLLLPRVREELAT